MIKENIKNFEEGGIAEIPNSKKVMYNNIRYYYDGLEKFCHDNNIDYYTMSTHAVNCKGEGFALFDDKCFVKLENGIWNFAE